MVQQNESNKRPKRLWVGAAGVLVEKDGLVLAVSLTKFPGELGIPCGKLQLGESRTIGAARECLEETGFRVTVDPKDAFICHGPTGTVVATYRASIKGGALRTSHEGAPQWVHPSALCRGMFGAYNRAMLEHFGYKDLDQAAQ